MDLLVGLLLEAGVFNSSYADGMQDDINFRFRAGHSNLYLWGGKEKPAARVLGQHIADLTIESIGVGARHEFGDLNVFLEVGHGFVDVDASQKQMEEVNYTYLVGRHAQGGRRIPLECADSGCYGGGFGTEYTLDDAIMGRVGLEYQVVKHVKLSASYRWMHADEYIAIYDYDRRAENRGWWEEHDTRNLGAFEIGILINY